MSIFKGRWSKRQPKVCYVWLGLAKTEKPPEPARRADPAAPPEPPRKTEEEQAEKGARP